MTDSIRSTAIGNLGLRSGAFIRHVYQKFAALTVGPVIVSPIGRQFRRYMARFRRQAPRPAVSTAIVAHLFYLDLLPELLDCRANLMDGAVLHLTVPIDRVAQARERIQGLPGVIVHPCENRGRDIAPFVALLNEGTFEPYDAVLKLHTKRSPHLLDGEVRRKLLFTRLAGERNATWRILAAFEDPLVGIVGWSACYRNAAPYWMANEARVRAIAAQMNATADAVGLGFFEGSMFWFRPAALKRLRDLQLTTVDFEVEDGQLDGTLHHAIERCFTIAARADGYRVQALNGDSLA